MKTIEVKNIADSFSNAIRLVTEHQKDGHVSESKGTLKSDGNLSVRSLHVTALGERLTDNDKRALKDALRKMNAGYAFQAAFGVKIAGLGQYAQHVSSIEGVLAESTGTTTAERTPSTEPASDPAHAGKRNGKGATVTA